MTTTALKQLLDSCFVAKRVIETLPELPPGMKPRHIHVLDAVHTLQEQNGSCRVSDVSVRLNVTLPSVTKLVQELESRGLLEKRADSRDGRVILLGAHTGGRNMLPTLCPGHACKLERLPFGYFR